MGKLKIGGWSEVKVHCEGWRHVLEHTVVKSCAAVTKVRKYRKVRRTVLKHENILIQCIVSAIPFIIIMDWVLWVLGGQKVVEYLTRLMAVVLLRQRKRLCRAGQKGCQLARSARQ